MYNEIKFKIVLHFTMRNFSNVLNLNKKRANDTKGTFKLICRKKQIPSWLKKKKTNGQTIVHKTQHRKLKTRLHEPHRNLAVI